MSYLCASVTQRPKTQTILQGNKKGNHDSYIYILYIVIQNKMLLTKADNSLNFETKQTTRA